MTDMPETIWIKGDPGYDLFDLVWHTTDESVRPCIQYTRTDTIPQVKVKPLVWEEPCQANNHTHISRSMIGDYYVDIDGGKFQAFMVSWAEPHEVIIGDPVPSLFEAQSLIQAHYDAAILSAIEGEG